MAPLTDPIRLEAFKDALSNWNSGGYIEFRLTETAFKWVKRELENVSLKEIGRLMFEHVRGGGEIDEVKETRPEWSDFDFHYDLRFKIQGKFIYIESRLSYCEPLVPDDSQILVMNIHAP